VSLASNSSRQSRDALATHAVCTLPNSKIGGDGFMALFSSQVGKVYLSYHHVTATIVSLNIYTGVTSTFDAQSNVPALSSFRSVGTPSQYGGQIIYSSRWMYTTVVAYPSGNGCQWGILCFDTQLNQFCTSTATAGTADAAWLSLGSTALACPANGVIGGLQPIPGSANSFVSVGPDGVLYCFQANPANGVISACGTIYAPQNALPGLSLTAWNAPVLITLGTKLYSYMNFVPSTPQGVALLCWDFANPSNNYKCGGAFAGGPVYPTRSSLGSFFNMYYPILNNVSVALCTIDFTGTDAFDCVSIDPASGASIGVEILSNAALSWMVPPSFANGNSGGTNLLPTPYYIGNKMYFGRWGYGGVDCYDWSTNKYCGSVFLPAPATPNFFYQVTQDQYGCLWALADSGETYVCHFTTTYTLFLSLSLSLSLSSARCNFDTTLT